MFNSIFWFQFYSLGALIIMSLHYYHIMLDFWEINSVSEGIFRVLLFGKKFFGNFLQSIFLGRSEIPNSADPCL